MREYPEPGASSLLAFLAFSKAFLRTLLRGPCSACPFLSPASNHRPFKGYTWRPSMPFQSAVMESSLKHLQGRGNWNHLCTAWQPETGTVCCPPSVKRALIQFLQNDSGKTEHEILATHSGNQGDEVTPGRPHRALHFLSTIQHDFVLPGCFPGNRLP